MPKGGPLRVGTSGNAAARHFSGRPFPPSLALTLGAHEACRWGRAGSEGGLRLWVASLFRLRWPLHVDSLFSVYVCAPFLLVTGSRPAMSPEQGAL